VKPVAAAAWERYGHGGRGQGSFPSSSLPFPAPSAPLPSTGVLEIKKNTETDTFIEKLHMISKTPMNKSGQKWKVKKKHQTSTISTKKIDNKILKLCSCSNGTVYGGNFVHCECAKLAKAGGHFPVQPQDNVEIPSYDHAKTRPNKAIKCFCFLFFIFAVFHLFHFHLKRNLNLVSLACTIEQRPVFNKIQNQGEGRHCATTFFQAQLSHVVTCCQWVRRTLNVFENATFKDIPLLLRRPAIQTGCWSDIKIILDP